MTLTNLALRNEGYKLTDGNHAEKWENSHVCRRCLEGRWDLNGRRSEEPSELVTLLCKKVVGKEKKKKQKEKETAMDITEKMARMQWGH